MTDLGPQVSGLSRFRNRVLQSHLARATLMISGATVLAQLVGLAAAPVMTRLFTPQEYGSFFIINAIGLALAAGAALRLEQAIPLPSDHDEVRNLVVMALTATLTLSLVTLAIIGFWNAQLADLVGISSNAYVLMLVAPLTASFALFALLNAVAIREGRFLAIARRHIVLAILTVVLQIGVGLAGGGLVGLCLATVIAQIGGAMSMVLGSPFFARGLRRGRVTTRATASRYRKFPLVLAPSGWLNSLGANAPLVVMGVLYAPDVAGWFGLTLRVVALPATFIGTAIASVYVSELARRHRERSGAELALFYRVSKNLLVAAVVFAAFLALAAPDLFAELFGSDWAPTGDMARAYAIGAGAQMVASPVSGTLTIHERVYQQISWDALRLVATVGSVWVSWAAGANAVQTVWNLSGATALLYAVNWEMCRRSLVRT